MWLSENPCADIEHYRKFVIAQLPSLTKLDNTGSYCVGVACAGAARRGGGCFPQISFADITEQERAESEAWWASVSSGRGEFELHRSPTAPPGCAPPQSPQNPARPVQHENTARPFQHEAYERDSDDRPPTHASVRSPPPPQTPPRALPQTPPRALQVTLSVFPLGALLLL